MNKKGELKVRLKTLTPIWTGGVDGTMDRIHETGILGSLRWWYEAIVRGLGGWACDPSQSELELTSSHLNQYKHARQEGKDWCDVCKVFGTTGWKKRFKLEIVDDQTEPIWKPEDRMLNIRPPKSHQRMVFACWQNGHFHTKIYR